MWEQETQCNISKMGTTPGMCLGNTRKAFGIPSKYNSAKDAMEAAKKAGHLHPIETISTNVAVPVFCDTSSPYEHVIICDHGVYYSDGKRVSNPQAFKFFGWSESLNDVRIVKWVDKPAPVRKSNEEIADEVIAGKWGNAPERYERLHKAGYDPAVIQQIVNEKCKKPTDVTVGDRVTLISWVSYTGQPLKKTRDFYFVYQITGNRVVLTADKVGGPIYAAVNKNNLRKV